MTLEFEKVLPQVDRMGRALAERSISMSQRAALAWDLLQAAGDLDAIRARVTLARQRDAGFRGAAPPDPDAGIDEPPNRAYPLPPLPSRATILAADGSQVYPDLHAAALYYLTNVGVFVYHHGEALLPEQITEPRLCYAESDVRDAQGQVVTNTAVNARRNVQELAILAREAWARCDIPAPLLAIGDGPLLWWANKDVPDGAQLENEYLGLFVHLYDLHAHLQGHYAASASLVGYVDRPTSSFIVSLLHLLRLSEPEVRAATLATNGDLEGLEDQALLFRLLRPGERSALLVQQSPANKRYRDKDADYEIAFFYLNVGTPQAYHFARVEVPLWVAREPALVDQVHALIVDQCGMMWRYPYALTRADELAVIRGHERGQLEQMIEVALRERDQPVEHSEKLDSKAVRHGRTRYGSSRRP